MIRLLAVGLISLGLAGCAGTTDLIEKQNVVAIPDDAQYNCPTENLPDPTHLTDKQVAVLIEGLVRDNAMCRASLASINIYETNAAGIVKVDPSKIHTLRQKFNAVLKK